MMKIKFYTLLFIALISLNGCDDNDDGPGPEIPEDALFAVGGIQFAGDTSVGLLTLVNALDAGQTDLAQALEIPSGANFATDGNGNIFVGRVDAPNLTRFTVSEDGSLVEGPTVSFANAGLVSLGGFSNYFQIISEQKAYFLDITGSQIIIWNPTEMTLEGSFPVEGLPPASEGGSVALNGTIRSGDQVIVWVRYNGPEITEGRTALVFIDVETDATTVDITETCGAISDAIVAENGDIYFASNNFSAASRALGIEDTFDPCWIRVLAGENTIDDAFDISPNDLTGSRLTAGLIKGPGNTAYVQAYDESLAPINPSSTPREVQQTGAWRLWKIPDLGSTAPATPIEGFPAGAGGTFTFFVNGRTYVSSLKQDFTGSTLVDITDENNIQEGLGVNFIPAVVFSVK